MKSCGIDLGTTNSCVYVVEEDGPRLVLDDMGAGTIPSVVFARPGERETVGESAKARIGESPGPVATIKRKMGSTETVEVGGKTCTVVEVQAMILRRLKALAEAQCGEEVDQAVVTVPAYFRHIQRQQTDEAAASAGFRKSVTLLEPVAAALAHSLSSDRDQLKILVYDLGGGTFDATVLEKDAHGGVTVLSFGGDPHLGGEDVDARLAKRLLDGLIERGYNLALSPGDAMDNSRFQRLKSLSEWAKQGLTGSPSVHLSRQAVFEDREGNTVDLDVTITREELEDCCRDLIERSVTACLETLEKGKLTPEDLDEIIMVGGMSRMPLAQRMLEQALGRAPRVVDPDLIVARGAAVKAAALFADRFTADGVELELHYDKQTRKSDIRIIGRLAAPLVGHSVYLMGDSIERSEPVDGADRFVFEKVPLHPGKNTFTIALEDQNEEPVIEQEIEILQDAETKNVTDSPGAVATLPIGVRTFEKRVDLLPEGTPLPHRVSQIFNTGDQSGRILAPILEGDHEVARLVIEDIPKELPVGSPVEIDLEIGGDYSIQATARLAAIDREVQISFRIDPVDVGSLDAAAVREKLAALKKEAASAAEKCPAKQFVELFHIRFGATCDQIEMELTEPEPKRLKLHEKLGALRALIDDLPRADQEVTLKPSFDEFSKTLASALEHGAASNHPKLAEARKRSEELRKDAKEAWERRDPLAWLRANGQIDEIRALLQPELTDEIKAGIVISVAARRLEQANAAGGNAVAPQIYEIQMHLLMLVADLNGGRHKQAFEQALALLHGKIEPLCRRLGLPPESAALPTSGVGGGTVVDRGGLLQ